MKKTQRVESGSLVWLTRALGPFQHSPFQFISMLLDIYSLSKHVPDPTWACAGGWGYKEIMVWACFQGAYHRVNSLSTSPTHSFIHHLLGASSVYIFSCFWTSSNYSRSHFPGVVMFPVFFSYSSIYVPTLCRNTESHRNWNRELGRIYSLPYILWIEIFH